MYNAEGMIAAFGRMQKYHKAINAGELFIGSCTTPDALDDSVQQKAIEFTRKVNHSIHQTRWRSPMISNVTDYFNIRCSGQHLNLNSIWFFPFLHLPNDKNRRARICKARKRGQTLNCELFIQNRSATARRKESHSDRRAA